MSLARRPVRIVFTFLHGLRRALWKLTGGPRRPGVHAVPMTGDGKVVLVLLTYAPGWRIPGGGRNRGETAEAAMLRELREEIGLLSHGPIERIVDMRPSSPDGEDLSAYFLVRDVVYRPRPGLEVEEVREFDPTRLPRDVTPWTARIIERCTGS